MVQNINNIPSGCSKCGKVFSKGDGVWGHTDHPRRFQCGECGPLDEMKSKTESDLRAENQRLSKIIKDYTMEGDADPQTPKGQRYE